MSKPRPLGRVSFLYPFLSTLSLTLVVYILRGLGILAFFPGGILLILIAFTLVTGFLFGLVQTRRF